MTVPSLVLIAAAGSLNDILMTFEARRVAQRIGGDRWMMVRSGHEHDQVMRALRHPLRSPKRAAAAVAVDARCLLARMKRRQRRRTGLGRLVVVRRFRLGVARRAENVLVLQRQRNPGAGNSEDEQRDRRGDGGEE